MGELISGLFIIACPIILIIFVIVSFMNIFKPEDEEEEEMEPRFPKPPPLKKAEEQQMQECPFCCEMINVGSKVCQYCDSKLNNGGN